MKKLADCFNTILHPSEGQLREKGSRFFGFAYRIQNAAEVKLFVAHLQQQFPDATHHCYAWLLSEDEWRAFDDGEPHHSAGTPILRAIQSCQLEEVLVVVVRYFGGKQLGVPGLIEAYKNCALETLKNATLVTETRMATLEIEFPFEKENQVYHALKQLPVKFQTLYLNDKIKLTIKYPLSEEQFVKKWIQKELWWSK